MIIMLTGSPSPGGGGGETGTDPAKPTGGGVTPGNPDSPGRTLSFTPELGSGPSRTLITSDKGTPAIGMVSGKSAPQTKTIPYAYTTTITGTVTTPAGNPVTEYDSAAGRSVLSADDAEVRASTDLAAKAAVAAHTQNIPLSYGYTATLSGQLVGFNSNGDGSPRNGATVTAALEDRVVNSITFNHPGTFRAAAGFPGLIDDVFGPARLTTEPETNNFTPVSMTV